MDPGNYSIQKIKEIIKNADRVDDDFLAALAHDKRAGVRMLYQGLLKREDELAREDARLEALFAYESELCQRGIRYIAGVDEVGRGPLAGPVVAAAVVLPLHTKIYGLNDSKQLTPAKREALASQIKTKAIAWGLGAGSVQEIERYNIHQAAFLAMQRALARLAPSPQFVLVDGFNLPGICTEQTSIKGGDALCASIAAASIIAKVARDSIMSAYSKKFPHYGFAQNKGYPTSGHVEALTKWGPSPLHRRNFKPVKDCM